MAEPLYDVVYQGEIIAPDRNQVITHFATLFKIEPDKAEKILSSSRRVLKKGVSEIKAQQYAKKLSAIGVLVNIERQEVDLESLITLEPEAPEGDASEPGSVESNGDAEQQRPKSGVAEGVAGVSEDSAEGDVDAGESESTLQPPVSPQLAIEEPQDAPSSNTNFAAIEDTSKVKRLNFSFTGSGAEFFKIWVVNVLLSIITLGIYSAWAKVRTNQYFYGNTWLDNASFEYLADPIKILKGRVIAVVLFLAYSLSQHFYPMLSPILILLFLLALPWLIASSLRFRMRNTAYRNIRFGFEGSLWGATKAYSLMFLLIPFTLMLLVPYMFFLQTRYFVDNSRYGVDHFSFNVSPREYYRIYIVAFLAMLAVAVVGGLSSVATPVLGAMVFLAGYLLVVTFVKVETINLMFDNSHLGDHQFSSSLEIWPYFQLYLVNAVLVVLTLGLFYPWAKVRVARYRLDNLLMMTQGSLNNYVADQSAETSAIGEEVGGLFDVDIGL